MGYRRPGLGTVTARVVHYRKIFDTLEKVQGPALSTKKMGRQYCVQFDGTRLGLRPLRDIMLQHAICRLFRTDRHAPPSSRYHLHWLLDHPLHIKKPVTVTPLILLALYSGSACCPDCPDCSALVIHPLGGDLSGSVTYLALHSASVCLLDIRRFQWGRHLKGRWGKDQEDKYQVRRRVRQRQDHHENGGLILKEVSIKSPL